MKKYLIILIAVAILFPSFSYAKGGFSGGSVHSSGSFSHSYTPSYHSSYTPSYHSSGSMNPISSYHSSGGSVAPVVHSSASIPTQTINQAIKSTLRPSVPTQTVTYHDTYSSNPFNLNFWFWMWIMNRHNSTPTVTNNATTTASY